jgi:GTPase SAR1 family protein
MMKNIKITIIGDKSVGKTSFISRLASDQFQSKIDYNNFYYQVNEGIVYNFTLVDIEKAEYIFLMFDLANYDSFDFVKNFINLCVNNKNTQKIILIGNKLDLIKFVLSVSLYIGSTYTKTGSTLYLSLIVPSIILLIFIMQIIQIVLLKLYIRI